VAGPVRTRRRRLTLAGAVGVVVLTFGAFWATGRPESHTPAPLPADRPPNRLAVLPFDDASEGGALRYFADGLAATLITHLTQVQELHVISHNGVRQFRDGGASIDSIARVLNVGSIVSGSVTESNGVYRVIVNLVDTHTGETLASEPIERPRAELLGLLDELSSTVAWMLRQELRQQIRLTELRAETSEPRAWEFVQRATEALDHAIERQDAGDMLGAEAAFTHALELTASATQIDDDYVGAYIKRSEIFERSMGAAFLTRPDAVGERLDSAEAAIETALRIAPQNAAALEQQGNLLLLRWVGARPAGQTSEDLLVAAERDLRNALRIQPNRARAEARLSQVLYQRGDFDEAYYAARRAYSSDAYVSRPADILWRLFETAFEIGEDDEAGTWCDELRRRDAASWLYGKCTLMLLAWGDGEEMDIRKALHSFELAVNGTPSQMRPMALGLLNMMLAGSYARVGDRGNAEASIAAARNSGYSDIALLAEEAAVRTQLGDYDRATDLIEQYVDAAPAHRRRITRSRWYEPLRERGLLLHPD
jgi:TolB-like protein